MLPIAPILLVQQQMLSAPVDGLQGYADMHMSTQQISKATTLLNFILASLSWKSAAGCLLCCRLDVLCYPGGASITWVQAHASPFAFAPSECFKPLNDYSRPPFLQASGRAGGPTPVTPS